MVPWSLMLVCMYGRRVLKPMAAPGQLRAASSPASCPTNPSAHHARSGHTVAAVKQCFVQAKDAGFKVCRGCVGFVLGFSGREPCNLHAPTPHALRHNAQLIPLTPTPPQPLGAAAAAVQVVVHMMPDLPAVGWERDIECFREFFENPHFRTDGLKLYPTLVIRGTGLYELWKRGLYRWGRARGVGAGGQGRQQARRGGVVDTSPN